MIFVSWSFLIQDLFAHQLYQTTKLKKNKKTLNSECKTLASPVHVCGASVCPQQCLTKDKKPPFSHTCIHTHTLINSPQWKPDPLHISSSDPERNA